MISPLGLRQVQNQPPLSSDFQNLMGIVTSRSSTALVAVEGGLCFHAGGPCSGVGAVYRRDLDCIVSVPLRGWAEGWASVFGEVTGWFHFTPPSVVDMTPFSNFIEYGMSEWIPHQSHVRNPCGMSV